MKTFVEKIKYNPEKDWDLEDYAEKYTSIINKFIFGNLNSIVWHRIAYETSSTIIDIDWMINIIQYAKEQGVTVDEDQFKTLCKIRGENQKTQADE